MSTWGLRGRALLERHLIAVVVVLVVLALVGGWVTYTAHVAPETTTERRTVGTWQPSGSFDHSATVTQENPLYDVGTVQENRRAYLGRATPILNGSYVLGYNASETGELETSVDLVLVVRNVETMRDAEGDEQTIRLWERNRTFVENHTKALTPEGVVTIPFSFNATKLHNETSRINDELSRAGTTEAFVRADVEMKGTVNGESVDERLNQTLQLTLGESVYRVGPVSNLGAEYEMTEQVTRQQEYGPLYRLGGPALLIVSVGFLVGLTVIHWQDGLTLTGAERAKLDYREDRSEFDEWITRFELPPEAFDRPRAETTSLGDLVDFAIDTDNGVIADPGESAYYVVHDEFLYAYTPPESVEQPRDGSGESRAAGTSEHNEVDSDGSVVSKLRKAAINLEHGVDGTGGETGDHGAADERAENEAEPDTNKKGK